MASGYSARCGLRQRNEKDYDHLFKLVIVGDCFVGKSCLLLRFADDSYRERHIPTIGVDFKIRTIELEGKLIKLQIWDTAGTERFQSLTRTYYRGADGIILVYDITNPASFENLPTWLEQVNFYAPENCAKLIIGNKSDLESQRCVEFRTAKRFADFHGIPLLEASAHEATNVDQAFITMAAEIKNALGEQELADDGHSFHITDTQLNEDSYYYSCDSCWSWGSGLFG